MKKNLILLISFFLISFQSAFATTITLTDVPGYGYNSGAYPYVGCGPTSGAMILDTYDNRLSGVDGSPGDLVSDPYTTAWDLHNNYMNTDNDGFGPANLINPSFETYAANHGYILNATLHIESTTADVAGWVSQGYSVADLALDANFWNTTTWDILAGDFIDFIAIEIDAGRPFMATVDSDGINGTDHWMVGVGYNDVTNQWAGYNTWDSTLHWYDVESGFINGNTMGIGYIRTFEFGGAINDIPTVPEPATIFLFGIGLLGFAGASRKKIAQ